MADPWSIPAIGWMFTVLGWLLSPIISFCQQKLFAYLIFDPSKELSDMESVTIPALKAMLREVEEQRMVRAARGEEASRSELQILDKMDTSLKSALCQAEDILDLVDYHRIEKKVIGDDGGSWGALLRLLHAAAAAGGSSIIARRCRGSWWVSVQPHLHAGGACVARWTGIVIQRCIDITPAPLLQFVQSMKQKLGQFLWSSGASLSVTQATSTVGDGVGAGSQHVAKICSCCRSLLSCGWCRQLVASITSCCRSLLTCCTHRIADARHYRDWSYEQVGIKSDPQKDGYVPVTARIGLRKQIKGIHDILTSSKKSNILNQNSSNTTKDDEKESSSNSTVKESSSKQKEHRVIEQKVFGQDEEREEISRKLREPGSSTTSKPYSVFGIYGITGSGKSTLAKYVCDCEKDGGHFNPIMFILVGKTFSTGDIFCDMLEQITQSQPSNGDGRKSIKTRLQERLKDKRFLLVLDDVWVNDENQEKLDNLVDMLRLSAPKSGSRVLVTAQKTDAAEALGAEEQIPIPDLEEEVYLSLFMHHARPDASNNDREYERIGRKIANRLCRSPIAAVTVGKQLQRNKSISFWETIANLDVLNKTMGALWWSYQQLGVDIRRCFAYCSTFPKGYRLKRDDLVRIWIAQGFVKTRDNATEEPEDIGQSYFDQLLTFSFLQEGRAIYGSETGAFTIHDLLHELAERVSGSDFFRIGLNGSPEDIPPGVHHLFTETKKAAEINEKILDLENLRTLIINEERNEKDFAKEIKRNHDLEKLLGRLFMRLKKLRVLIINGDIHPNQFSVPASIDHTKLLRYLGLHSHRLILYNVMLPTTFSKLYHIQTIDIACFEAFCPEDMANLLSLRHFSGPLSFPNIGCLKSLQTLPWFEVKEEEQGYGLKQLMHLNKLRGTLSIEGLGKVGSKEEALEAHLAQKELLRRIELDFGWTNKRDADVEAEVLEVLCPPKDLQQLSIRYYKGSSYPSWMLSRHHSESSPKHLHRLVLNSCSQLASIPEDSQLFIGLRELFITLCDWDRLPEHMERLVSLQTLKIWCCDKMELLPTLPHQALKTIIIWACNVLNKTCKEEGHENWRKIQHIPQKDIW